MGGGGGGGGRGEGTRRCKIKISLPWGKRGGVEDRLPPSSPSVWSVVPSSQSARDYGAGMTLIWRWKVAFESERTKPDRTRFILEARAGPPGGSISLGFERASGVDQLVRFRFRVPWQFQNTYISAYQS